ncbi:hypothetical protein [Butyrivibrio sp. NC2007]|uniref:hypothetical protein n=1 Tax=Butyrivibrio sp. NC2007 TaxID=1280683 RepID=UPI0003B32A7D|nr:hypothetical protein [Butyrivibrio sp. NC2007]
MERKTGTPIEKWDDVNGKVPEPEPEVVEQPVKLPQEQDPNIIGNVRRGLEDQLEQNDNMIGDGVINNLPEDAHKNEPMIDNNANGIPDEDEKPIGKDHFHEVITEREEKTSLLKELHECKHEPDDHPCKSFAPELVL